MVESLLLISCLCEWEQCQYDNQLLNASLARKTAEEIGEMLQGNGETSEQYSMDGDFENNSC